MANIRYSVVLVHSGNDDMAQLLHNSLDRAVSGLGVDSTLLEIREDLPPARDMDVVYVGVYLASASGKNDAEVQRMLPVALAWGIPFFPVISVGDRAQDVLPEGVDEFNACRWQNSDSARLLAHELLRTLHLTEAQRRVFISYVRKESLSIAQELWETLSASGFEVFLDTISIRPGQPWRRRIYDALDRMAVVLVVESPSIRESSGVELELTHAREMDLGLVVLTWPQTVAAGATLPGVYEKYRIHVPAAELSVEPNGIGHISGEFVGQLVGDVEERHAEALLRRRRVLMDGLASELQRVGISFGGVSEWSLVANTTGRKGSSVDHVFSITPRAPEVPDLFALDSHKSRYGIPDSKGVLVHPVPIMGDEDAVYLKWAIAGRDLALVPAEQLVAFIETL